ncbi:hypothetical protein COCMIDRAFT_85013 [Bipolaris oryzae ATCC 44560]|uniref:SH3 domain-containing protein n=1 Tax=Bipolaris oryzae ATCC 44560 TaxID=930090 RepID=W6ZP40_COCMI|nr:uncharacterized protein COCMIDRAFT_85013 [Bipolaris oryzae ATCC 44560]EUC49279.1 hypothetical protein COCMIDRAFT_85013 [Bipolaris oryzae ATCC 44560]
MGATATEPPSVSLSFANNFWGKDDAGVGPMLDRMHAAKVTNDELKHFYAARASIEEDYARKLLNLSRKPLGSCETGTLRLSCDVIRAEVESMGKAHQNVAQQMKTELEEPLAAFAGGMKERRKIVQNGIEKLLKLKMQQTSTMNKARDKYEQDCLKIKGFLAQAHMVMGQEERKNKAKLEKTQINLATTSADYEAAVKVLEETTGRWNRDWKAACDKFQDLEEERIDYTKSSLWNFANIASTVCVSDDASCEKIRLSLEDCDVEKDITGFIKESGTGQEIPDAPKFINFCRGDAETSSQVSEDENYSVAQFARTLNPAYRASSPAPSNFDSHHDPNNPLAREMGLQRDTRPILPDDIDALPLQPVDSRRQSMDRPRQSMDRPRQSIDMPRQSVDRSRQSMDMPRQSVDRSRQSVDRSRQSVDMSRQAAESPQPYMDEQQQYVESPRQHVDSPRQRAEQPRQSRQYVEQQRQYIEQSQQHVEPLRRYTESPRLQYAEPPRQQYTEPPRQQYTEPPRQQYVEPPKPQYTESSRQQYVESPEPQYVEPPYEEPPYEEPPQQQYVEPPEPQYTEPPREQYVEPPKPQYTEPPKQQQIEPLRKRADTLRQRVESPQPMQSPQATRGVQPDPRLVQAQEQARQQYQQTPVALNDYPTDGMTQFCRIGAPSDRSSIPSPVRPASRGSQSDCSNPNSFSSVEPPSGSCSPGKPMAAPSIPEPSPIEETSVQKKRGFFNSPFVRRKSKHEIEPPALAPSTRKTWTPPSRRNTEENNSLTKPFVIRPTRAIESKPASPGPEPADPRANFQLNVGNNVFDVASPDKKKEEPEPEAQEELDPIAQALEELRGVTKQTSVRQPEERKQAAVRQTADRYLGLATPAPPATPAIGSKLAGSVPTPLSNTSITAAKRGTPPPSYEQPPMSRLGAPKPAHTARQMQKTTQMYVNQKVNMFNGGDAARPPSRSPTKQEAPRTAAATATPTAAPRTASPVPARAVSPRPTLQTAKQTPSQNSYRTTPTQQQPQSPTTYQPMQRQSTIPSQPAQRPPSQASQRPLRQQAAAQPVPRPASRQQSQQPKPSPAQPVPRPASRQQAQPQATPPAAQQASRPISRQQTQQQQPPASPVASNNRTESPNPYAPSSAGGRPRAQTGTASAQAYGSPMGRNTFTSSRGQSPTVNNTQSTASPKPLQQKPVQQQQAPQPKPIQQQPKPIQQQPKPPPPQQPPQPAFAQAQSRPQSRAAASSRAASPNPQFRQSFERPGSSLGSEMALALSTAGSERGDGSVYGGSQYGGSVRGRANTARPQSSYMGSEFGFNGGSGSSVRAESRLRSKSLAEPKNYNSQGRLILNYSRAMYSYAAQIPEELGFQKGDILAVLRLQDDGWWEAEAVGKQGRPGLVPSNYLQPC